MRSSSLNRSLESWLCLAGAPGIGPRLAGQLLRQFGGPERVFAASDSQLLAVPGLGPGRLGSLRSEALIDRARRHIQRARRSGFRFLTLDDPEYPSRLRLLSAPPPVLSVRGKLSPMDSLALTVVGPRNPSEYARRMTRRLIPPLTARGISVVSGLAQGIDAEAHKSSLDAGGRTLAVLGQGLDTPLYPSSNLKLAERIVRENQGAILSPFPIDEKPQPGLFPQRNELLAALGLGLLVIEAGERSGALITARHALDFGHTVLAVPADADRPTARGSNRLLAEGAILVQSSDDILEALAPELRRALDEVGASESGSRFPGIESHGRGQGASPLEPVTNSREASVPAVFPPDRLARFIGGLLEEEQRPLDFILQRCAEAGFGHGEIVQRLLELEMSGVLTQLPGRIYSRGH